MAEERARAACVCPGCQVTEIVDGAIEAWDADDRMKFMRILVAQAERLGRSLTA